LIVVNQLDCIFPRR